MPVGLQGLTGEGSEGGEEQDDKEIRGGGGRERGNYNHAKLHQADLDHLVSHQWWVIGEGEVSRNVDLGGGEGEEEGVRGEQWRWPSKGTAERQRRRRWTWCYPGG